MSIVYTAPGILPQSPQTHVLIVGVGQYDGLTKANVKRFRIAPPVIDLRSLTASTVSAEKFAQWMISSYNNPRSPLGTVDILLSRDFIDAGGIRYAVDRPTFANIEQAIHNWYDRCNASRTNTAIFYFCGHGVENTDMLLLPSDFLANIHDPWSNAINLSQLHIGMAACKAETQCFLIDACRETSQALREANVSHGRPILNPSLNQRFESRDAPIFMAAAKNRRAYARQNEISYFTEALIFCLDSIGISHLEDDRWVVTTRSLGSALLQYMSRQRNADGELLKCAAGGEANSSSILHVSGNARVSGRVSCRPREALAHAHLQMVGNGRDYRREPIAAPWELEVAPGLYTVSADFPNAQFSEAQKPNYPVSPPFFEVNLDV